MTIAAYRDRSTGRYPISLSDVRLSVSVLFGPEPDASVLDEANVDPVFAVERPAFDDRTHSITEGSPELVEDVWRQTFVLTAIPLPLIVIPAEVLFFERMTDIEYDGIDASVKAGETARVYRGWSVAREFVETDAPGSLWMLLLKHIELAGISPARRAALLARS